MLRKAHKLSGCQIMPGRQILPDRPRQIKPVFGPKTQGARVPKCQAIFVRVDAHYPGDSSSLPLGPKRSAHRPNPTAGRPSPDIRKMLLQSLRTTRRGSRTSAPQVELRHLRCRTSIPPAEHAGLQRFLTELSRRFLSQKLNFGTTAHFFVHSNRLRLDARLAKVEWASRS